MHLHPVNSENHPQKNMWIDILLLTLFIGLAFAFMLGSRPLNVPDEGRYCEIAREMLLTHNFITPKINGIIYFEKPVLFYWMQAFFLKFFGLSEWSCRAMDALLGLLGCLAVYFTGRKIFNRKTGLFAAIILSSSLLYFSLARVVTLDMAVSVWLCLSLCSFILGVYVCRYYFYLFYIFAAFALLTKGLIGIIFPGSIILIWIVLTKNGQVLKNCYVWRGLALFLVISLPWHIAVQLQNPEFFHFYFIDQQFSRYLTLTAHRYQPDWYYIPLLLLGFFPWTGFLYGTIKRIEWRNPKELFFLIAAVFIFIFFSFSKSKLVPYILPCFPFLAILAGRYFSSENPRYLSAGFIVSGLISLTIAVALPFYLTSDFTTNFKTAQNWSYILIAVLLLNTLLVPVMFYKKGFLSAFKTQLLTAALFLFCLCAVVPYIYMGSVKTLALTVKSHLKPGDRVATYDYYYQDLPFYLNHTVSIINWKGELEFGSAYTHPSDRMLDDESFWRVWESDKIIYMILPTDLLKKSEKKFFPHHFYPLTESKNDIVVTNHEVK